MATSQQHATKRKRALEQLLLEVSFDICPSWPASPALEMHRVLLRPQFFINSDRTMYMSVGFYPTLDNQPLVEFIAIRSGGSNCIVPKDEYTDTLADCLPKVLVSVCNERTGAGCVSGAFRLSPPKKYGSARLYFGTQYVSLTILHLQYLAGMFHIVQQQLRHYTTALPNVLSFVTSSVN